ncbi:hypothetical protein GOODEAATRI_032770, partial [Goodea atripinnis]
SGEVFSTSFSDFCKEYRLTGAEIRRILTRKMTASDITKIHNQLPVPNLRLKHKDWDNISNMEYRNAVTVLAVAIKTDFPRKINMTSIYACKQKVDEDINDFITRVIEAVTKYSGIETPTEVGTEAGVWETLVCDAVIKAMLPHLAQHLKGADVGWADHPRLADVRKHAKHAQLMFEEQQQSKKEASDKELHLAMITMYQNIGRNRDRGY